MKKIALILLTTSFFSLTQAEYILTSPLTGPRGIMEESSIIMKAAPIENVPDAAPVADTCDYDRLNGLYWMVVTNEGPRQVAHVSWNGTTLYDYNGQAHINDATQVIFNGITYKRGEQKMVDYYSVTYGVCRVNS
jgi:hypothetical protein